MEPKWSDIEYLDQFGCWPDKEVPIWVEELCEIFNVHPVSTVIRNIAAKYENSRLRRVHKDVLIYLMENA